MSFHFLGFHEWHFTFKLDLLIRVSEIRNAWKDFLKKQLNFINYSRRRPWKTIQAPVAAAVVALVLLLFRFSQQQLLKSNSQVDQIGADVNITKYCASEQSISGRFRYHFIVIGIHIIINNNSNDKVGMKSLPLFVFRLLTVSIKLNYILLIPLQNVDHGCMYSVIYRLKRFFFILNSVTTIVSSMCVWCACVWYIYFFSV